MVRGLRPLRMEALSKLIPMARGNARVPMEPEFVCTTTVRGCKSIRMEANSASPITANGTPLMDGESRPTRPQRPRILDGGRLVQHSLSALFGRGAGNKNRLTVCPEMGKHVKTVKIIASLALAFASALTLSACVAHSSSGSAASPSVSKTPKPFPSVTVRSMEEQTTQISSDGSWSYVSNDGLQVKVNADGSWTKTGIMGEETAVSADGSWTHKARIEIAEQGTVQGSQAKVQADGGYTTVKKGGQPGTTKPTVPQMPEKPANPQAVTPKTPVEPSYALQ